jgi:hypothetical protein
MKLIDTIFESIKNYLYSYIPEPGYNQFLEEDEEDEDKQIKK